MGGQGFIPEDGEGGIVEGMKESKELEQKADAPFANAFGGGGAREATPANGPAPRRGMQGTKERGAAPTQVLARPGTTPAGGRTDVHRTTEQSANTTGTGEGVDTGE
jgi:hypothetical protein